MHEKTEYKPGIKNEKVGSVVSAKMAKTIVVEVSRKAAHPVYKRVVTKRKKFYAHDEKGEAKPGDVVRIIECRQFSRSPITAARAGCSVFCRAEAIWDCALGWATSSPPASRKRRPIRLS